MTPPAFPAPRVVAGWLKHLSRTRPVHALAAGTITVRWIEAAVRGAATPPSDPLADAVLRARTLRGAVSPAELDRLLHLGEERVAAVLREGLARPPGSAVRRRFAFRHGVHLPLPDPGPFAVPVKSGASVRPHGWAWLRDRLGPDVGELLAPGDWRAVPLERDDPLTVVLALDGGTVAVYPTASADAGLPADPTARVEGDAARVAFPELFAAPSDGEPAAAWGAWAASRAVPADDVPSTRVTLDGLRLRLEAPPRLADWLRANRADAFTGGTWVWVGGGAVRRAAELTV